MNFIFGFVIAVVGLVSASKHLHQNIDTYWDFVAFAVVFCGTISVLLMTRPKLKLKYLSMHLYKNLFGLKKNKVEFIKRCFKTVEDKKIENPNLKNIEEKIMADGLEMINLDFSAEKIEEILQDRYFSYKKMVMAISAWIKRCAKYPPAFGLGGTILGLIHLMKGISTGLDPKETGLRMAVALVATFYGLLLSNLVLNPMSESIVEKLKSDEELVEASIKTVLIIKAEYNLLECQEVLNSFLVDEDEKIDFLQTNSSATEQTMMAA